MYSQRDRAWDVWPYPCIGQFRFLDLSISLHPLYPLLQQRLHSGQSFLDLGCCFGQDIRKFVFDGVPEQNLIGCDLHQGFLDLGYDLFRDRDRLASRFFAGDILASQFDDGKGGPFDELRGKIDIIHASSFFHLFSLSAQLLIAKRLLALLRHVPGSLVLGRQTANIKPGVYTHGSRDQDQPGMWRHDVGSWSEMWEQAGREIGAQVRVTATLQITKGFSKGQEVEMKEKKEGRGEEPNMSWRNEGDRLMVFEVWLM